jgi:PhnB protein
MTVRLNPYLNFRDSARQVMEFYRSVFGGELTISTFAEMHASEDPAEQQKIMHSQLEGDNGIVIMAADLPNSMEYTPAAGMSISLSGDDEPVLRGYYDKLCVGGTVLEPLMTAPWGDTFGMCIDQFGITWLVNIAGAPAS